MKRSVAFFVGALFIVSLAFASTDASSTSRAVWTVVALMGGLSVWATMEALRGLYPRCPHCDTRLKRQADITLVRPTRQQDGLLCRVFSCPRCDYRSEEEVVYLFDNYLMRQMQERGRGRGVPRLWKVAV